MQKLLEQFNEIYPLSAPLRAALYNSVKFTDIRKRKILLRPGQVCDRMYFIERGLLRGSKIEGKKESCLWFMKENDLMTSISSYYNGVVSAEYIYAMEDSRLLSISKQELQDLKKAHIEFNVIVLYLTEKYYVLGAERENMLRIKRAPEKYRQFLKLYPGLDDRLAAKYIASFLGITLETLSRIKNKRLTP